MAAGSGRFPRVAVLKGGMSAEREVSLVSGRECAKALREAGYTEVVEVDCGPDLPVQLSEIKPEIVFNALHGRWGEDGCVQGLLEWLRIPYTHSGVLASALAMDKAKAKEVYAAAGLPIVQSRLASREEVAGGPRPAAALCGQAEQRRLLRRGLYRARGRKRPASGRDHARSGDGGNLCAGARIFGDRDGRPRFGRDRYHHRRLV